MPVAVRLFLIVAGLLSFASHAIAQPLRPLRVYLDWFPNVEFAGMYAAQEKGWYREAGIDLKLVFEGLDIIPNVLKGKADIGMHSAHDLIRNSGKNSLKAFAAQYQLNPNSIIVPQNSPVQSIKDLKGKTLGLFSEQERDMYRVMLGFHGLSLNDVKFKQINTFKEPELIQLMRSGQVDAMIAWEFNWTITFALLGYPVRVFPGYENGFHFYGIVFFAPDNYIKSNQKLLRDFLEVTFRGWREVFANPEPIVRLVVDKHYLPAQYINGSKDLTFRQQLSEVKLRKRYFVEGVGEANIGQMSEFKWEKSLEIAKTHGIIPSDSPLLATDLYDDSIVRTLRATP